MRRPLFALFAVAVFAVALASVFHARDVRAQGGPPPQGQGPGGPPPGGPGGPPPGGPGGPPPGGRRPYVWNQAHADSAIAMMLDHIKGKEDMPAESVYKNIKILNGMPAKNLPKIMWYGFGRGVGMGCGGCHVRNDFASDDMGGKRIARQMWAMSKDINQKYLPEMKDIEDDQPMVNCWSCHRGQHVPQTDPDRVQGSEEHHEGNH